MPRASKWLAPVLLAFGLFFAPFSAWSEPRPSSSSVSLSQAEYDKIVAEIQAADQALKQSSETIAKQEKDLRMLSLFSLGLGLSLGAESGALLDSPDRLQGSAIGASAVGLGYLIYYAGKLFKAWP
jgi:hypothetical protein